MTLGPLSAFQSNLLLMIFAVEIVAGFCLWRWLTSRGSVAETSLSPHQRSRVYLLVLVLLVLLILFTAVGGILSHFDRPWYAVTGVSNNGWILIPAHYYMFLVCYPAYIILGCALRNVLKNWLPDLFARLKWSLLITVITPFFFIPALDGHLLDYNVTTLESIYLFSYWIANLFWIGLGVMPLGFTLMKHLINDLGHLHE